MINASLDTLMPVYDKLFNSILPLGTMPQTWYGGLQSINREGRNDPADYRDICVFSCLGKLFRSILNQRLLEHIMSLNTLHLHKSQIGFLPNNRTADNVFAPRTLIDKYVHNHKEKMYACFVGFRKAFDSV